MRFPIASTLALFAGAASAASSWGFSDGAVEVVSRSSQGSQTHQFSDKEVVSSAVTLGHGDKLKVSLTTKDGSKAKRPHQAFLTVKEASGLEAPFALTVKESGKGTVEIVCPLAFHIPRSPARVLTAIIRHRKISPSNSSPRPNPSAPALSLAPSGPPRAQSPTSSTLT